MARSVIYLPFRTGHQLWNALRDEMDKQVRSLTREERSAGFLPNFTYSESLGLEAVVWPEAANQRLSASAVRSRKQLNSSENLHAPDLDPL